MELLNPQTLETFRELMDPGELRDFLQRARQELLRSLGQMQAYFAAKEWDRLKVVAQRLRGTLGFLGRQCTLQVLLHRLVLQLLCGLRLGTQSTGNGLAVEGVVHRLNTYNAGRRPRASWVVAQKPSHQAVGHSKPHACGADCQNCAR